MPYSDPKLRTLVKKRKVYAGREYIRAEIIRIKSVGICADCGGTFPPYVLEFDHIEPCKDRHYTIASIAGAGNINIFRRELAKCELVCANCHKIRTYRRSNEAECKD